MKSAPTARARAGAALAVAALAPLVSCAAMGPGGARGRRERARCALRGGAQRARQHRLVGDRTDPARQRRARRRDAPADRPASALHHGGALRQWRHRPARRQGGRPAGKLIARSETVDASPVIKACVADAGSYSLVVNAASGGGDILAAAFAGDSGRRARQGDQRRHLRRALSARRGAHRRQHLARPRRSRGELRQQPGQGAGLPARAQGAQAADRRGRSEVRRGPLPAQGKLCRGRGGGGLQRRRRRRGATRRSRRSSIRACTSSSSTATEASRVPSRWTSR